MATDHVTAPASRRGARRITVFTVLVWVIFLGTAISLAQGGSLFGWREVAPSPQRRFEGPSLIIGDELVIFGGFDENLHAQVRVDAYNPATNSWRQLNDMPTAVTHIFPVKDGNTVWFVGGFVGNDPGPATAAVWQYDAVNDTWSVGPELPAARAGGTVAIWGRALHYIGGFADRDDTRGEHYVLDLDRPLAWTTAAALPEARGHSAGAAIDGTIYVIGGQIRHDTNPVDQAEVFAYNTTADSWRQVADLPADRSHFEPGLFVMDGRIVVAGGRNNVAFQPSLPAVTMYDPAADIWIALPDLPTALLAPAMKRIDNDFVLTNGGFNWDQPQATTYISSWDLTWETGSAPLPTPLGSTAAARVGPDILVVGADTPNIYKYDLARNAWSTISSRMLPPFPDENHAAVSFNGEFYLFGGLSGAAGQVQIYDPAADSWRTGTPMPFAAGAAMATVIGSEIYVAGGVVADVTTDAFARYSPATDSWTSLPAMPQGRHYAAAGTDGSRFYIFGGRDGGFAVSNGFDTVQIYDPAGNSWRSSADSGSTIIPLPQARSGMGRAVFFEGEFYVMGGETDTGAGASAAGVYNRVDIYNPATNTWRPGPTMPTARHGVDPVIVSGRIYTFGGGTSSGDSATTTSEVLNPVAASGSPTAITTQTGQSTNRAFAIPFIVALGILAVASLLIDFVPMRARARHLIDKLRSFRW